MKHFIEIQTEAKLPERLRPELLRKLEDILESEPGLGQFLIRTLINQSDDFKVDLFAKQVD